jgi:hypothetical protein
MFADGGDMEGTSSLRILKSDLMRAAIVALWNRNKTPSVLCGLCFIHLKMYLLVL